MSEEAGHGNHDGVNVRVGDDFIREVRENVTPGTSALFVMTSNAVADRVLAQFRSTGATLISTNLSAEQEARLRGVRGA
ncbi:MAG: hypothetical protein V7646_7189 [Pseudonocardia sp.]